MEMNKFDKVLEFVVLGGFVGMMIAMMRWIVPEENAQHFSQALGAWIVIATLVAKSLWERNSTEAKLTEAHVENVAKSYDAINKAADSTPMQNAAQVEDAAHETAEAARKKAEEFTNGNAG